MSDTLHALVDACRRGERPLQDLMDHVPYARFLGLEVRPLGDELLFVMPVSERNVGNPTLPALHGGAIAGFMEQSALVFLMLQIGERRLPKTIDFTIDYLRAGLVRDTFAECSVTRLGRRIANVHIRAWQASRDEPITVARSHFLLSE